MLAAMDQKPGMKPESLAVGLLLGLFLWVTIIGASLALFDPFGWW